MIFWNLYYRYRWYTKRRTSDGKFTSTVVWPTVCQPTHRSVVYTTVMTYLNY